MTALKLTPADRDTYRHRRRLRSVTSDEMVLLRDRLAGKTILGEYGENTRKLVRGAFRDRDWTFRERLQGTPAPMRQMPRLQWRIDQERGWCDWPRNVSNQTHT